MPFLIRGPNTKRGIMSEPTSNVDWASTVLSIAGARARVPQDGMSLTPYLTNHKKRFGRAIFYETTPGTNSLTSYPGYVGIKLGRWKYVEYTNGDKELFDVKADSFELKSLHADAKYAAIISSLSARLKVFRTCKGQTGPNACLVRGVKAPAAP